MPTATLPNQSLMQTNILDKDFDSLINIDEIRESLRQLDEEENRIDAFLDDTLKQESILDTSLNSLKSIKPQLDTLKVKAATFTDTVSQTAHLAEVISDKVRQLDKEQTRAKLAIKYVEDVQELKFCISSLNEAMQKKEYDRAALLLQRASKIDSSILKGSLAEFTVPTSEYPDHPERTLAETKAALFDIFSRRFDDAVAERNQADITRYFKLFPLINCQTEGLDQYSRFVCNIIKSRCADEMSEGLVTAPTYFADALTRLFENIAVIIDQHQPLVEMHYGKGKMLRVIQRLQEESDKQGVAILDRFLQTRKLETKLVEIQCLMIAMLRSGSTVPSRASPNPSTSASTQNNDVNNPLVDPRQLDANLYELSLISQRTVLFNSFMSERASDEMDVLASDEKELVMKGKDSRFYGPNGLLASSGLSKRVHEMMNSYLVIDEYLLKKSITKAIHLDDYDPATPHASSTCVDDVFFILKTILKRCISTYKPDVISSTVRTLLKALENQYIHYFQQHMSTVFTAHDTTGRNAEKVIENAKISYMVVLNNLDISADYTHRLAKELQPEITRAIWLDEENDVARVTTSIDKFEGIADKFNQLLKHGVEQLVNQVLKPRIRPLFQESYREVKYVLEEDEYNEADIEEKFVKRFRQGFNHLIHLYKRTLTENNFNTLMDLMLDIITAQWERIVSQTRFNQYGALRFDKDLRSIILYLSSITEWLSRDKFTRLNQMSTILNFEEPSEIHELWGNSSSPINWRLTVNEVKKILGLRLDFESKLADEQFLLNTK
ncbi:Golgi transport complex subunit 4 [Rhizopus azygosporus]|uniref:Conserved oligomeric Golgi complex subunit 4 n=1 Tax=Rhizopus azygosporus TaxID=86630 RepID=A0A367JBH8_RHIAZ|nr:Golgi transport complex subunit 4 [Rhizopus azygosporus]